MIKMTIDNKQYVLSETLTIDQWQKAVNWDFEEPLQWPHIVHAVTDIPMHLLKDADRDSLELCVVFISAIMQQRKPAKMMNLNEMKFGEWVDLDIYSVYGVDKKMQEMMDILSPEAKTAAEALWVLDKYIEFKKFITRQYKELFGYVEDQEPIEIDGEPLPQDPMQSAKAWYKVIVNLAGDDVLKLDEVTMQPIKKIFNFMALQKEEALREQERQRQQKLKYDLQRTRR